MSILISQVEKGSKGTEVRINDMMGFLAVGSYSFKYSEILPVLKHYICGGFFGHNSCIIVPEDLQAIREFIREVGQLKEKEVLIFEHKNIFFCF